MRTKIVYTLISNTHDIYLEQLWLSITSLRLYNKNVHVTVVMDNLTSETLVGYRSKILELIDEKIVVVPPEDFDNRFRSRYIKIQLRQLVTGDYLFVDTDTIINGSLESVDRFLDEGVETGMVLDGHRKTSTYHRPDKTRLGVLGWDKLVKNGENYYNSGVILMKDSIQNHQISELWYENWQYEITKGIHYDQVALLYTLKSRDFNITELPGEWNCQVTSYCSQVITNSKIIHYFNLSKKMLEERHTFFYYFSLPNVFWRIKEEKVIPPDVLDKIKKARLLFFVVDDISLKLTLEERESILHKFYLYYPKVWNVFESWATLFYKIAKHLSPYV